MTADHTPKHLFDPAKAERLLDHKRRMIDDPLALVQEMGIRSGMRVVDMGCGAGFFTKALLEAVGPTGQVAAIEQQEPVFKVLQKHISDHPNLESYQADLTQTELQSDCFDAVFIAFTLHEVTVKAALTEFCRILKPNGILTILDWGVIEPCPERQPSQKIGPPKDHRLLLETLRQQLQAAGLRETATGERLGGCHYWIQATSPSS